jgi:phenylacetic acid degradation operon negative regulatory protein
MTEGQADTDFNSARIDSLPVRTQFLIFTLFGDYVTYRGGKIWTSNLIYLMELLGVSERAVRSTLSRMTRKGWIGSKKYGRRSRYSLTRRGHALLEAGRQRIFEPVFSDWNQEWHLVVYSLPEEKRRVRHTLRTQLSWLGYGSLAPGTWISPHGRNPELEELFSELEVEPYVSLFCGQYSGPDPAQKLVQQCWDLDGLAAQYKAFFNRHYPAYLECLNHKNRSASLKPEECFLRRFWLMHEYQSFPFKDPNLPKTLLPPDWVGFRARKLFDDYRELLGTYANQFVDESFAAAGNATST